MRRYGYDNYNQGKEGTGYAIVGIIILIFAFVYVIGIVFGAGLRAGGLG